VGIGSLPKPQSHDGSPSAEKLIPVLFSFQPAGRAGHSSFHTRALPMTSARVFKAQVRSHCSELAELPDKQIRILYRGVELPDDEPVSKHIHCNMPIERVDLQFLILGKSQSIDNGNFDSCGLEICESIPCSAELENAVQKCLVAMRSGVQPILSRSGSGGVYLLRDAEAGKPLIVFKPKDEEAGAPQNPRGFVGLENSRGARPGVPSAHRAVREVAAYLLDHAGAASVPMTTLARGKHVSFVPLLANGSTIWKVGALQLYVDTMETADNFGFSIFDCQDVHRIGILDVRIANSDRNYGNMLVKVKRNPSGGWLKQLVPIDHGCSLPDRLGIRCSDVVWMAWPQARLSFKSTELSYIARLDAISDAHMLGNTLGLERPGLRMMEVTTLWLKSAASHCWTLHEIGNALYRSDATPHIPSKIEMLVASSIKSADISMQKQKQKQPCQTLVASPLQRSVTHTGGQGDGHYSFAGGLFSCYGHQESRWNPEFEDRFRRHVGDALEQLARLRAPKPDPQIAPEGTTAATSTDDADSFQPDTDTTSERLSFEALPRRSASAYIPPHLRKTAVP